MKCNCVNRFVSITFRKLGLIVGKKPVYFIVFPILLSAFLATGVLVLRYEDDTEYLFTPNDGLGKKERNVVETLFPMNLSKNFDIGRWNRMSPFAHILLDVKDGKSIFDKEIFSEIKLIDKMVRNVTISYDKQEWRYEDICARRKRKCFANDLYSFENRLDEMEKGIYSIDYPLMISNATFKVIFSAAFLGEVKTDVFGKITSARAVSLLYFLENDGQKKTKIAKLWEASFLKMMEDARFRHINIAYYTSISLTEEIERNAVSVIPLFSITVIIMLVFSCCTCMMSDWVKSKPWLGIMGFFSSIIAIVGAFGFTMFCGLEFIGLNLAAPFLMLGIGMDDTFVFLAAWRRTDTKLTVPERMSMAYEEAGVSITITSLTNFVSFSIGVTTPFPCVQIFCTYTAMAVLFAYIYHVTFFGGCMALCGYLEQQNRHSFICIRTVPVSLAGDKGTCFKLFCTGGKNTLDSENPQDNQEHMVMKFFRDQLGNLLSRKLVKVGVIFVFLVYLGFGVWGCTQVEEGFEWYKIARYDSYTMKYYKLRDKYFREYPFRIQVIINQTLNYADPNVQDKVEKILATLEKSKYMAGPRYTESWLRIYRQFLEDKRTQMFIQGFNMSKKEDFYRGIHNLFFRLSQDYFRQDIKFNDDFTEITASRFVLQSMNIMNTNDERDMVRELRRLAENATVSVTVFNHLFVFFDQYVRVKGVSLQAVGVATAVMTLITFFFINSSCAFWVAVSIVSIEIGLVGYMSWWNVSLDGVSMINIIQCIGFSVDYSAHITYAYTSAKVTDPNQRMRSALYFMGLPIAQGSISTIIGISILNFAPSYVYSVFFKTVFLVMLFAAMHGLLFLPVFLSLTDILFSRFLTSKAEDDASSPNKISSDYTDFHVKNMDKITSPAVRAVPEFDHLVVVNNLPIKYLSAETWTDNDNVNPPIGTREDSRNINCRHSGTINPGDKPWEVQFPLTFVDHLGDSPRCRVHEDHTNPGSRLIDGCFHNLNRYRLHNDQSQKQNVPEMLSCV